MNAVEKMLLSYPVLSGLNALYAICNNRVQSFRICFISFHVLFSWCRAMEDVKISSHPYINDEDI